MTLDLKPSTVIRVLLPHGGWHEVVPGSFTTHGERVVLIEHEKTMENYGAEMFGEDHKQPMFSFTCMEDGQALGTIHGTVASIVAIETID